MKNCGKCHRYYSQNDNRHERFKSFIKITIFVFLLLSVLPGFSQNKETDSLLNIVTTGKDDSVKVNALISLTISSYQSDPDKALQFANHAKDIAVKIKFISGEAYAYKWLGIINNYKGNYYEALINSNKSLNLFETLRDKAGISNILNNLGAFYADKGEYSKAVEYYLRALDVALQSGNKQRIESALGNIGVIYSKDAATNDKALEYYLKALPYGIDIKDEETTGILYTNIGEIYAARGLHDSASFYYKKALKTLGTSASTAYTYNDLGKLVKQTGNFTLADAYFDTAYTIAKENNSPVDIVQSLTGKAQLQIAMGNPAKAIPLFDKALKIAKPIGSIPELKEIYTGFSTAYTALNNYNKAFSSQNALNDLYKNENQDKLSFNTAILQYTIDLQKQSRKVAVLVEKNKLQEMDLIKEKFIKNISIASLAVVIVFAIFLLINSRQRQRLNKLLFSQKEEIEAQKLSVENALIELKAAQSQLIQSEKMASLGELTAGIAHEIQNPLNFVNNFSEVNAELITEMKEEILKGNIDEVMQIAKDIEDNERKINNHGKRADAIVRGMLQHSRKNVGHKEFTDINALVAEFLRLCYHNIKANDKAFHVEIKTDFDTTIGKINIIPQDIGRVLLNLFNNAFYAVKEKTIVYKDDIESNPSVTVSTKKMASKILIIINDNGSGISEKIMNKIFNPFFTTKPAGKGTGLGLSLSYDIIKAHGGEIKVESKEGEGATFIIELPY